MEADAVSAVVSMKLKVVGNKLASLLIEEYTSIVGVKRDLEDLRNLVEDINGWLEKRYEAVWDGQSFNWLKNLKDVTCAFEDVVDEFQLKADKDAAAAAADGGIITKCVCTKPKSFILQWKMACKIKKIKRKFAKLVKQRADYNAITSIIPVDPPVRHMEIGWTVIRSDNDVSSIVGRDEDRRYIISKLQETDHQLKIKIISVIGLGGSGKTTLATLVFNDGNINKHFSVKLWVHVSQEFDVDMLVKQMFEALADNPEQHGMPYMRKTISDKLNGKRFLLVLDDVWTESQFQWKEFGEFLINIGEHGSRILLTTRSNNVAETVGSTDLFMLPLLSKASSWQLFIESYGMAANDLASEFLDVGKEIVDKCGGVPMAIQVLAGVLRQKEHIDQWKATRDSNLLHVEGREHRLAACLSLSYFHLPLNLKQCLNICSVFPKGHRIGKEQLIDLWIAHGTITPENGVEYLEDIGHKCFNSLLQISFLQAMQEEYGRVTCMMHYLIHDLARTIMGEEISLIVPEVATSSTKSCRYFSITECPLNLPPKNLFEEARAMYVAKGDHFKFGRALQNAKYLRSITVEYTESIPTTIFRVINLRWVINLRYLEISGLKRGVLPLAISDIWSLQALHVTYCDILNLPKSIGNLQKLRTLNLSWCKRLKSLPGSVSNCHMISNMDLSGCIEFEVLPDFIGTYKRLRVLKMNRTKIKRLPSSVTSLENLECLDLQHCSELVELPEGLDNLKKLKVLNREGCPKLNVSLEEYIGQLGEHQNVNIFIVGENKKCAKISELRNINGITYLMNPGDEQKTCLEEKKGLQRLRLQWGRNDTHKEMNLKAVFDGLKPPSGIKELYVGGYAGGQYAQWMLKQVDGIVKGMPWFPDLTVITLCGLPNLKDLNGLMELPRLKELDLRWMPSLESISGGPFPLLSKLRMEGLRSLEEVWMVTNGNLANGEEGQMQIGIRLSKLHIEECPKLKVIPYFPSSLEHLVLHRSNEQLLLSSGQVQGPSSSSSLPPSCRYSHLKELELWGMTSSSSPTHGPGSILGWNLLQHMSTLESLKICQCGSLTELPNSMRSLTSLQSLLINFCSAISKLPEWLGELRSLQKMAIQSCHSLSSLQSIGNLASLQELRIERCDELLHLPECLGELCSLRKFDIASLHGVTFLPKPMCRLTSLEELEISDCQGLTSLPEWIRHLPSLQKLKITGCPELERRCEGKKGEDWHLISHIPHRQIGFDEEGPAC